jgi:quinolinate synthase
MSDNFDRIRTAKAQLGDQLVILGHHYQRDEVLQFADFTGDSLKLSQNAAAVQTARYVIFCGVHFMAESAAIVGPRDRAVILPNLRAGCSMADMAKRKQVEPAWEALAEVVPVEAEVLPITYINSTADVKAFVGQHGGIVCTSGNAAAVLTWAFQQRRRVFFIPDQHLGRNTAKKLGIPLREMVVWNPDRPLGGNTLEALRQARVYLWDGDCCVHQEFWTEHVAAWRAQDPQARIIVHPECQMDVVDAADLAGSTEFIIQQVANAPAGTHWVIGTEVHLVDRLKHRHPEQVIDRLSPLPCLCRSMDATHPEHLLAALEALARGEVINRITVPDETARWARVALDRMLNLRNQ